MGSGRPDERAETPPAADRSGFATITLYPDGPIIVRGSFRITEIDGSEVACVRRTIALCRCGRSRLRPFCDGTHKAGPTSV
jgi:hypothetical protein